MARMRWFYRLDGSRVQVNQYDWAKRKAAQAAAVARSGRIYYEDSRGRPQALTQREYADRLRRREAARLGHRRRRARQAIDQAEREQRPPRQDLGCWDIITGRNVSEMFGQVIDAGRDLAEQSSRPGVIVAEVTINGERAADIPIGTVADGVEDGEWRRITVLGEDDWRVRIVRLIRGRESRYTSSMVRDLAVPDEALSELRGPDGEKLPSERLDENQGDPDAPVRVCIVLRIVWGRR
jgi:hypothetical protein